MRSCRAGDDGNCFPLRVRRDGPHLRLMRRSVGCVLACWRSGTRSWYCSYHSPRVSRGCRRTTLDICGGCSLSISSRVYDARTEPVGASTLEIRRPAESYDGTFADQRGCGIECRTSLSTGQARWVRVVEVKRLIAQTLISSTFHRALHGKECAAPGSDPNDSAVCVVDVATLAIRRI